MFVVSGYKHLDLVSDFISLPKITLSDLFHVDKYLAQVQLRTEGPGTPSLTRPGFKFMTSRSSQDISCH